MVTRGESLVTHEARLSSHGLCTLYMTLLLRGSCVTAFAKLKVRSLTVLLLFIPCTHAAGSFDLRVTADSAWLSPTDQHPSGLEMVHSLERCSCSTKMLVVFEVLELLSLEGLKTLRMIELEAVEAAMLRLVNPLPMVEDHPAFGDLESFA